MFQVCELRKNQLVEAHIRLYVIRNEVELHVIRNEVQCPTNRGEGSQPLSSQHDIESNYGSFPANSNYNCFKQSCAMRLNHPNDELGSMLLLMTPQIIVHELDIRWLHATVCVSFRLSVCLMTCPSTQLYRCSSPLMPPPIWNRNDTVAESVDTTMKWVTSRCDLMYGAAVFCHLLIAISVDSALR